MANAAPPQYTDASSSGGYGGKQPQYYTYQRQVKLGPGQSMHYTPGRGFYAGPAARTVTPIVPRRPAPPPPTPPTNPFGPSTPQQIDTAASAQAQSQLDPQEAVIRQEQQQAAAQALAQQQEIAGFQSAAAGILAGVAPTVGAGYNQAADQLGNISAGVSGGVKADLQTAQAADAQMAASQGQSGGSSINPADVGNAIAMGTGEIPGEQLLSQGAAAQRAAAEAVQLPLSAGMEEIAKAQADARAQNDSYAQQLLQIAQQYPGLKAQALQQLNQYELDKANYRRQLMDDQAANKINAEQAATQRRAEIASERATQTAQADTRAKNAATAANQKATLAYRWASLQFQSQKAAAAAQAAVKKGKTIDVQASKLLGHIVYKDGSQDPSIHVKQSQATTPQQKAVVNRAKSVQTARVDAFKEATRIAGKPTAVPANVAQTARATGKQVGQYIAAPNQKYNVPGGVFPPAYPGAPATTNNPARAARSGASANDYAHAQQMVWGAIGGDSLMSRYNLTRAMVMQIVNAALTQAGWVK